MYHRGHNIVNKIVAVFVSCLMLFANECGVRADNEVGNNAGSTGVADKTVSDAEVKAFRIGAIFMVLLGIAGIGAHFPVKEVSEAMKYRGVRKARYKNFITSFSNCIVDEQSGLFQEQEGRYWDWAACLGYVMKSQNKGMELNQKDIVKKLFDKCAFFGHNRKESLPINAYYSSELLESIHSLAEENGMVFVRELTGFGMNPRCQDIKEKILKFYNSNDRQPFVINDSYFYNENPFIHFVVISEIDEQGNVTVKDPLVGLTRKQSLDVFCQGYVLDNGHAKLPSLDMYTLRANKN